MAKRKQVKNACVHCQRACKKCDDTRPCIRCTKYGLEGSCVDSPRKERKSKRRGGGGGSGSSSTLGPAKRRREISVSDDELEDYSSDDDELASELRGYPSDQPSKTKSVRLHLKIDTSPKPAAARRRKIRPARSTTRQLKSYREEGEKESDNEHHEDDHDQRQMESLRSTYRITKTGSGALQKPFLLLSGMESWDAATAASSASQALYLTAQHDRIAAIARIARLPGHVVRTSSPIGALAAVCADLAEKPLDAIHLIPDDPPESIVLPDTSSARLSAQQPFEIASFPTSQAAAPVPARFPTPPETPIHHWLNYTFNQQRHKMQSSAGSPQKVSPAMMAALAKATEAINRARSTSPVPEMMHQQHLTAATMAAQAPPSKAGNEAQNTA